MKMKIKNLLKKSHDGVGGLYFILTSTICAVVMVMALHLSWDSQALAMADNLAHISSINCTVNAYTSGLSPNTYYSNLSQSGRFKIPDNNGNLYDPLYDFNQMLKDAGISANGSSSCKIIWTGKGTYLQFSDFETSLGTKITPHQQESVIEEG